MPVTVIVGGQYGGEGKGKVSHYFYAAQQATTVVRCGGPNSGHTVYDLHGRKYIFRHLPTPAIYDTHFVDLVIGPGSFIDPEVLQEEIAIVNDLHRPKKINLFIDNKAIIIRHADKIDEANLIVRIRSTGSGTGEALVRRIKRKDVRFAKDHPLTCNYTCDTTSLLRRKLNKGERIIIEGTQGYGLSNIHSPDYPYVTSRDTTAAAFVSECGLSPLDVDQVILVIRTYPIRVGGCSGPLSNEISWDELSSKLGKDVMEFTSVTKTPRRIGHFDPELVKKAIEINRPTSIVLNHVDYWFPNNNMKIINVFFKDMKSDGIHVDYIGTSPKDIVKIEHL